jgi:predicted AlkP superfamily pyrophosphatase or phosphodiesterase
MNFKTICAAIILLSVSAITKAQTIKTDIIQNKRPKLVVGIVVDQMRWDYLYRYYDRYKADGGFKRLLSKGFSYENAMIPYTPTYTACGHATIFTGSVPAIHGITGNDWWDRDLKDVLYCTEDFAQKPVGSTNDYIGHMSPKNMLTTTIGDELRLATNFKSKVIGLSLKDRASILPAGHSANAAYWYDNKSGNFMTSTYYMSSLPEWMQRFNNKKMVDAYYKKNWNTLYPINTYTQSTADNKDYESDIFSDGVKTFPYVLDSFVGKNYKHVLYTPYGNSLLIDVAKETITHEKLGRNGTTDLLTLSFSAPDYIGHSFGTNAIEVEDCFLRLDIELGNFLTYLDKTVGIGAYTVFLTADHGVAHNTDFNKENKLPGRFISEDNIMQILNKAAAEKYGIKKLVVNADNYQYTVHPDSLAAAKLDRNEVVAFLSSIVKKQPGVSAAFDVMQLKTYPMNTKQATMLTNGYFERRNGDIQVIYEPGWTDPHGLTGMHGIWNPYDAHIPLLFYGYGIKPGRSVKEVYMTDIAPTIAALLRIQMPNGCIGTPLAEAIK